MRDARSQGMASDVFRRIVVPTDFSEGATEAWGLARRMARALGSELTLLHVFVEPPAHGDPYAGPPVIPVLIEAEKWVTDELEKWAAEARKEAIAVRTFVRHGSSPATRITELAGEEHADLVIMGTHGRGGVTRLLLGSVADRVIRTAPCPVLTVRTAD
jgi:universal stress protein A